MNCFLPLFSFFPSLEISIFTRVVLKNISSGILSQNLSNFPSFFIKWCRWSNLVWCVCAVCVVYLSMNQWCSFFLFKSLEFRVSFKNSFFFSIFACRAGLAVPPFHSFLSSKSSSYPISSLFLILQFANLHEKAPSPNMERGCISKLPLNFFLSSWLVLQRTAEMYYRWS